MPINEIAGNIDVVSGTVEVIREWLSDNPDTEIIDVKYSATYEDDFICVVFRR